MLDFHGYGRCVVMHVTSVRKYIKDEEELQAMKSYACELPFLSLDFDAAVLSHVAVVIRAGQC